MDKAKRSNFENFAEALQRFYFLQTKNQSWTTSRGTAIGLWFIQVLQTMLIMFPWDIDTYPWALDLTSGILLVLNLLFRPDVLLFSFIVADRLIVTAVLVSPLLFYLLCATLMMRKLYNVTELEFIKVKTDQKLYAVVGVLNVFVFRILYVPVLANACIQFTLETTNLEVGGQLISIVVLLGFTQLSIYDRTYKTTVNWFDKSFETMARLDIVKRHLMIESAGILITCLVANDLFVEPLLVVYIALSSLLLKTYLNYFPYHVLKMNKMYINVLVLRIWIAVILILAQLFGYNDQDDLFGISMLILISPTILTITNHWTNHQWNEKVMNRKQFDQLWELEHIIRAEVLQMKLAERGQFDKKYEISEKLDQAFKAAYEDPIIGKNTLFYLFLCHIMIKIGRVEFVKKILGTLCSEVRIMYLVEIQRCKSKLYSKIIAKNRNELEIVKYIQFQKERQRTKYMEQTTLEHEFEVLDRLQWIHKISDITEYIKKFYVASEKCKKEYKYVLQLAGRNPRVVEDFATFLDVAEQSKQSDMYAELASNYRLKLAKARSSDKSLSYYDDENMVMMVNLEKEYRGNVEWHNDSKYNYKFDLKQASINYFVHQPVVPYHTRMMNKIDTYGYDLAALTQVQADSYIRTKDQYIMPVQLNLHYVNIPHLAMLVGIKFRVNDGDFALLTDTLDRVRDYSEGYQRFVKLELDYDGPIESVRNYFDMPELDEAEHGYILFQSESYIAKLIRASSVANYRMYAIQVETKNLTRQLSHEAGVNFGASSESHKDTDIDVKAAKTFNKSKTRTHFDSDDPETNKTADRTILSQNDSTLKMKKQLEGDGEKSKTTNQSSTQSSLIERYVDFLDLYVKKVGKWMKILICIAWVLCTALAYVYINLIYIEEQKLANTVLFLDHMATHKHNAVYSSLLAKQLYLEYQDQIQFDETIEETKVKIVKLADEFIDMRDELLDLIPTLKSDKYKRIFEQKSISWYSWRNYDFVQEKKTLPEAVNELANGLKQLGEAEDFDDENFRTVYRNGFSDSLRMMNTTSILYLEEFQEIFTEEESMIVSVIIISALALILCLALVMTVLFIIFERKRRLLWTQILKIPHVQIIEQLSKVQERLFDYHNIELAKKQSDRKKKDKKNNSGIYKMLRGNIWVIVLMSIGVLLFAANYIIIYEEGYNKVKHTLELSPIIVNIDGDRITEGMLLVFWMRELFTHDIYQLIEHYQPFSDPHQEFERALHSFVLHSKTMNFENEYLGVDEVKHSTEMNDILFAQCDDCDIVLQQGLSAAVLEFEQASDFLGESVYQGADISFQQLQYAENIYWTIEDLLFEVMHVYEEDEIQIITDNLNRLYPISVAIHITVFVIFFVFVYHYVTTIITHYSAELYLFTGFLNNNVDLFRESIKKFDMNKR